MSAPKTAIEVAILTTTGPSLILHLKEIPAQLRRSSVGLAGMAGGSGIDGDYTDFVRLPTGVIESLFGHPAYRLDVSAPLSTGTSWQFGVLMAHALERAGRLHLGLGKDAGPDLPLVLLTGTVRCTDLAVGEVGDVDLKAQRALPQIAQARSQGRAVLFGLPRSNLDDLTPRTLDKLTKLGATVSGYGHIQDLLTEFGLPSLGAERMSREIGLKDRWSGPPYRGLDTFGPEHRPIFFGRSRAREEVLERLRRSAAEGMPFILVHGRSGAGKSSLIAAGLIGDLAAHAVEGGQWTWSILRLGEAGGLSAFASLRHALSRALPGLDLDTLGTAQPPPGPERRSHLLVLDQLEQALVGEPADDLEALGALLTALVRSGRVWIAATMRSDHLGALSRVRSFAALARDDRVYRLDPPGLFELTQMIVEPAALAGISFAPGPHGESLPQTLAEVALRSPDSLPLLQMILLQLSGHADAAGVIPFAAYGRLGGFEAATGRAAEAVAQTVLARGVPVVDLDRLLASLVRIDPHGGRALARSVAGDAMPDDGILKALIDGRIVTEGREGGGARLSHEALITHWPRLTRLTEEIRGDLLGRDRIEEAMRQWQDGGRRTDDLLLSPVRLPGAEAVARRALADLSPAARAFLQASRTEADHLADAERDRKTRESRLWRNITYGAGAAALGLGILAGVAIWQRQAATEAEARAIAFATLSDTAAQEARDAATLAQAERDRAEAATEAALQSERSARAAVRTASNFAAGLLADNMLAMSSDGQVGERSLRTVEQILLLQETLTAIVPETGEALYSRALALISAGGIAGNQGEIERGSSLIAEGVELLREAAIALPGRTAIRADLASALNVLGLTKARTGGAMGLDEADALFTEAETLLRTIIAAVPGIPEYEIELGLAVAGQALADKERGQTAGTAVRLQEGLGYLRDGMARVEPNLFRLSLYDWLLYSVEVFFWETGDTTAWLSTLRDRISNLRKMMAAAPGDPIWIDALFNAVVTLSSSPDFDGPAEEKAALRAEAVDLGRRLREAEPDNPVRAVLLARSLGNLSLSTELAEVPGLLLDSIGHSGPVVRRNPGDTYALGIFFSSLRGLNRACREMDCGSEVFDQSVPGLRWYAAQMPDDPLAANELWWGERLAGKAAQQAGDMPAARDHFDRAAAVFEDETEPGLNAIGRAAALYFAALVDGGQARQDRLIAAQALLLSTPPTTDIAADRDRWLETIAQALAVRLPQ